MKIDTGRGSSIPLVTLVSILSISALTSLPGLAVSPILGDLNTVFPGASDLEIQTLSSLPSLLIVPFILLSGKLTEKINNIFLLRIGLIIFFVSGILYLLSNKMWQLIAVSVILGIGAGIIIPLSTGLISKYFSGDAQTKQFGMSSALTNMTLVIATLVTGYLANINWRLPFVVYLLPIFVFFLTGYIKKAVPAPIKNNSDAKTQSISSGKYGIDFSKLNKYMLYYFLATFLIIVVSFNLPFLFEEYHYDSDLSGMYISLFFLSIMAPGFFLKPILAVLKSRIYAICMLGIAVGMFCFIISHSLFIIAIGCILTGVSYGIIQPYVYNMTTFTAIPNKITLALAIVMTSSYVAILIFPFVASSAQDILGVKSETFAFWFNMVIAIMAWTFVRFRQKNRRKYMK